MTYQNHPIIAIIIKKKLVTTAINAFLLDIHRFIQRNIDGFFPIGLGIIILGSIDFMKSSLAFSLWFSIYEIGIFGCGVLALSILFIEKSSFIYGRYNQNDNYHFRFRSNKEISDIGNNVTMNSSDIKQKSMSEKRTKSEKVSGGSI